MVRGVSARTRLSRFESCERRRAGAPASRARRRRPAALAPAVSRAYAARAAAPHRAPSLVAVPSPDGGLADCRSRPCDERSNGRARSRILALRPASRTRALDPASHRSQSPRSARASQTWHPAAAHAVATLPRSVHRQRPRALPRARTAVSSQIDRTCNEHPHGTGLAIRRIRHRRDSSACPTPPASRTRRPHSPDDARRPMKGKR